MSSSGTLNKGFGPQLGVWLAFGLVLIVSRGTDSYAQPASTAPNRSVPVSPAPSKSEAEFLVPPQGGAFDVPLHAGAVTILSFDERLSNKALSSSPDFEIKAWGDDGVAVRPATEKVSPATLALATVSGTVKINVTLHVVPANAQAFTLVRFKAASAEDAMRAQVAAEVAKRVAPLQAQLETMKKTLDAQIRDRADGLLAERLLRRHETVRLESHARNDDSVIAHLERGLLFGDDGYLIFQIENRSTAAYRLATVRVTVAGRDVSGPARLDASDTRDPSVIGTVPAGATVRGVVVVRSVDQVLGRPLVLEFGGPQGRGAIRMDRGVMLK